jgi:ribonuclease HII
MREDGKGEALPSSSAFVLGADENGLGPRLGPLLVTAVLAKVTGEGAKIAQARAKGALRQRLGDSKTLVSFGDSMLGEAWARVLAKRTGLCAAPASKDELVHALSIDPRSELRLLCPSDHVEQCWAASDDGLLGPDAKLLGQIEKDLDRLAARGVEIVDVRAAVVCTKRLNNAVATGKSRFHVDLHTMERLVLHARERAGTEIVATCGKVGGFDRYGEQFGPLSGRLHVALEEGRARSTYKFPGVGTVAFVRDADDSHMLVSMASLVGKWLRDVLMMRIVRYHRAHEVSLPDASGYHDPVTTRFIHASALSRKNRGLPDACFLRNRLENEETAARNGSTTSSPRPPAQKAAGRKPKARQATP